MKGKRSRWQELAMNWHFSTIASCRLPLSRQLRCILRKCCKDWRKKGLDFFDTFAHGWAVEHSGTEQNAIFRSQSCFFLLAIMDTFGSFQPGAIKNIKFLTIAALQFLFRSIASNCLHNQIYHSCVPRNCTRSYGNTDLFVFKEIDHSSDIPAGQDQVCVSGLSLHLGSSCQETLFWQRYW